MGNVLLILLPVARACMKLAGMKEQNVEIVPGTTIKFWTPNDKTTTTKPPVVLLHGFFGDGIFTWFLQMLALTKTYAVYVPDLIFFGGSTTDNPNRSTSFQAECLAKGLKKLGVEKCSVVGFSYGGMVAFKLAKMYPDLVGLLIVTGTVVEMTESLNNGLLKNVGCSSWSEFLIPGTVEGVRWLLSIGSHNPIFGRFPDFVYRDFLEVMFENRKERAELLEALVVPDVHDFTPPYNYSQKIHLLWGNSDTIFDLQYIREQLGDSTVTWHYIEKAGHIAQLDRPNLYNHHLKTILASVHN